MTALSEALRELLQQRGVLSETEIAALERAGELMQQKGYLETVLKGVDAARAEMFLRLLRDFEGPPQ